MFLGEEKDIFKEIEECARRVKAKKEQLADMQNELDLLMHQEFTKLSDIRTYLSLTWMLTDSVLNGAKMIFTGTDMEGHKLDKRKKYEEIQAFQTFARKFEECLGIERIHITDIMYFGLSKEGYYVNFLYQDVRWSLYIPLPNRISYQLFEDYGEWYFKLNLSYYKNDISSISVGSTFKLEDLKDIMAKGIDEVKAWKESKNA